MDEQRLADYLAGELTPDEQAALEQQLAGDAALRARLARMREADEALASLSSPEPRPGFEERLHAALAPEVERVVSAATTARAPDGAGASGADPPSGDELGARRARRARGRPGWPMALGGVAAGVALLALVGVALSQLAPMGGDDGAEVALDDAGGADEMSAPDGEGPTLLATDRDLDDEAVAALLEEPALTVLGRRHLDEQEGARLAEAYRSYFADDDRMRATSGGTGLDDGDGDVAAAPEAGADAADGEASESDLADGEASESDLADGEASESDLADGDAPTAGAREQVGTGLDAAARADMRRCLATLLEDGPALVPAYAEATTYQGESAIAFGLLGPGADGQRYDRLEVWVLERDDCQVRTFQQRDL